MRDYRITLEDALSVFKGLKQNVERLTSSGYIQLFQDCVKDLNITLGVNEQLRAKIDELKSENADIREKNSSLNGSNEKLKEENERLKGPKDTRFSRLFLTGQVSALEYSNASLNNKINELKANDAYYKLGADAEHADLKAENKILKTKVKDLESRNDFLNKCDTALNEVLKGEIKELKEENSKMKSERIGSKPYYQSINKYVNKIKELVANNTDLKTKVKDLEDTNNWFKKYDSEIQQINASLRSEIEKLKAVIASRDKEISIAIKAGHKFYQTDELKEENNKLKERNEYLEEAENEYADKCEEKYMLNKQLKAKVDELEEMMIVQEKDYALLEKDIDKYESIIKGFKTQNEQLEKDVHILELKEETQEDFCNACSWCP